MVCKPRNVGLRGDLGLFEEISKRQTLERKKDFDLGRGGRYALRPADRALRVAAQYKSRDVEFAKVSRAGAAMSGQE